MNKRNSLIKEIEEVNNLINNMPTLNEALSFNENSDEPEYGEEYSDDIDNDGINPEYQNDLNVNDKYTSLVNKIRKMALEGMSELAETVDNPNYQILKKIGQFCEKKPDENKKMNNNQEM